jgi:hypothetical protein
VIIGPNIETRWLVRVRNEPARQRRPFAACGRSRPAQKFRRPGVKPRRRRGRGHAGGQAQRSFVRGRHASRARTTSVKVSLPRRWWRPASICRGALGSSRRDADCEGPPLINGNPGFRGGWTDLRDRPSTTRFRQRRCPQALISCSAVSKHTLWIDFWVTFHPGSYMVSSYGPYITRCPFDVALKSPPRYPRCRPTLLSEGERD